MYLHPIELTYNNNNLHKTLVNSVICNMYSTGI